MYLYTKCWILISISNVRCQALLKLPVVCGFGQNDRCVPDLRSQFGLLSFMCVVCFHYSFFLVTLNKDFRKKEFVSEEMRECLVRTSGGDWEPWLLPDDFLCDHSLSTPGTDVV